MFAVAGNVPYTDTGSQTPLVAINASVGTGGGAGAGGVVEPGTADGLDGDDDWVVEEGADGPAGSRTTGGAGSVEGVGVVSVGGGAGGAGGAGVGLVVSCWTKGVLVL